jgi:hypothetical protein
LTLVNGLITKVGDANAVGPNALSRMNLSNWFTGEKGDFIAGVQQLTSQETLNQLLTLKKAGGTLGALSEKELQTLQSSATKINSWAIKDKDGNVKGYNTTEASFKTELERIQTLTVKALQEAMPKNFNLTPEDQAQIKTYYKGGTTANSTPAFNPGSYY